MTARQSRSIATFATSLLSGTATAFACPNCYGASDSNVLSMYYLSAIMLTLLPFTIVGGIFAIVSYLRRQAAALDGEPIVTPPAVPHAPQ